MSLFSYCSNLKYSKIKIVAIGAFLLSVSFSGIGYASGLPVGIVMDGIQYPLEKVTAMVDQGTTWVPLRFVSDKMGAQLNLDPKTKKIEISKGDKRISLTVGSSTALVNGATVKLGSPVMQQEGTTMIPLRFVSEQLSAEVNWDSILGVVNIHTKDKDLGELDPFGRKMRTINLPKNAKDYPYIIEGLPNEMYEMQHKNIISTPETAAELSSELDKLILDQYASRVEKYGNLLLNIDYSTIDQSWVDNYTELITNQNPRHISNAKEYVQSVKKNHIQVQGTLIPEPSMVFAANGDIVVRCQIAFRITSSDTDKEIIHEYFFPDGKFKKNTWYVGYTDIGLSSNVFNGTLKHFRISPMASFFKNSSVHVLK